MTTSVFYPSDYYMAYQYNWINIGLGSNAYDHGLANAASMAQSVNSSGTKSAGSSPAYSMVTGTLASTPTNGDVLIAVIGYGDNNAITTSPSGWTLLTSGGTAGSRRLEIWWYRSTGIAADKGPFTFATSAGATFYGTQLFDFTGNAAAGNPVVDTAATAFASGTSATATATPGYQNDYPGMTLTAFVVGGGTISGISGSFSGTGTQESHTTYIDTGFNRGASSVVDQYNNSDLSASPTFGTAWSWTTARPGHIASITLSGGGRTDVTSNTSYGVGTRVPSRGGLYAQMLTRFDTSSIPDSNTISSATLQVRAGNTIGSGLGAISTTDPANADLQARLHSTGSMPSNTRGNNNNHWWLSSDTFAAKTLLATYSAANAWTDGVDYSLTNSGSALINNISKTSGTVIAWGTTDQANKTDRSTSETYSIKDVGTYTTLTVVHSFIGSATVAASLTVTPTISRAIAYARTIASNLAATPAIATVLSYGRTIASSITTSPTITNTTAYLRTITSDLTVTPTIVTARAFLRTIASTLTTTPTIIATYLPFTVQVARIIRLGGRSTIQLVQTVTARLGGRSTIRAPKE
jgi:hypothetical protein